jgi:hypothetical protein
MFYYNINQLIERVCIVYLSQVKKADVRSCKIRQNRTKNRGSRNLTSNRTIRFFKDLTLTSDVSHDLMIISYQTARSLKNLTVRYGVRLHEPRFGIRFRLILLDHIRSEI